MSKRIEPAPELPTYEEMQAAVRAGRRLRAEAFAEFFGFGPTARRKASVAAKPVKASGHGWFSPGRAVEA